MQFKRAMADKIFDKENPKTQTRRLAPAPRWMVPGRRVPVQCGYRGKALGYIVIDKVYRQSLDKMMPVDIRAEGFNSFMGYIDYLRRINKKDIGIFTEVTVYEFHLEADDDK